MKTNKECQQCGLEIPIAKQRIFISKTLHIAKKQGRIQAGPFCNNTCRAAWRSDLAAMKFNSIKTGRAR